MNAARTHHSRLIMYDAPNLRFDGREALKAQMRKLFARRPSGVTLRDAQKWFRGTAPAFVQEAYFAVERETA